MHHSTTSKKLEEIHHSDKSNTAAIVVLVFGCLLAASICPLGIGEGAFPTAEYHIQIEDLAGTRLSGARMSVQLKGKDEEAFGYPFDNYTSPSILISDGQGQIVV